MGGLDKAKIMVKSVPEICLGYEFMHEYNMLSQKVKLFKENMRKIVCDTSKGLHIVSMSPEAVTRKSQVLFTSLKRTWHLDCKGHFLKSRRA